MAMSGVPSNDEVISKFQELKLGHKYKFLKCNIQNKKEIVLNQLGDPPEAQTDNAKEQQLWNDFVFSLPNDDCMYAVYDFAFSDEGGQKTKLLFITWCPDSSKVANKMLYASSKDNISKKLEGIQLKIQANDHTDLAYTEIMEQVKRKA